MSTKSNSSTSLLQQGLPLGHRELQCESRQRATHAGVRSAASHAFLPQAQPQAEEGTLTEDDGVDAGELLEELDDKAGQQLRHVAAGEQRPPALQA